MPYHGPFEEPIHLNHSQKPTFLFSIHIKNSFEAACFIVCCLFCRFLFLVSSCLTCTAVCNPAFSKALYRQTLFCHYHNMTRPGLSALEFYFRVYRPGSSLSKLLLKLLLTSCQTRRCIFNAAPAEGSHQIFVSSSVEQRCTYTC